MIGGGLNFVRSEGCWPIEYGEGRAFRWTRPEFEISAGAGSQFVTLELASLPESNAIQIDYGAGPKGIRLLRGWQRLDLPLGEGGALRVNVQTSFRPKGDGRELGLMLKRIVLHSDPEEHRRTVQRHSNALLNEQEYLSGRETLASVPPLLRITTSKTCNIANEKACVYCSWDWAKRLEKGSADCTPEFLSSLGRYIDLPLEVTDCSYGEPPLEKGFADLLAVTTDGDRRFEFTSNGQPLSAKIRAKLLGKTARVYVSVDSASATGYRRYRDHRFNLVIENLRALCAEKTAYANLPEVYVSFIVMRSNLGELPSFLDLMKDVGVDRVVLRTLYLEDHLDQRRTSHYGYAFDYDAECLALEELKPLGADSRLRAAGLGLPISIEWEDFARDVSASVPEAPICSEPWKAGYLLNRGITPCCYVREPMVEWADIDTANLEGSIAAALNSEQFRELRRDLAQGRLGKVCERATGCPIVRARAGEGRSAASNKTPLSVVSTSLPVV
jgi:hypothetical protein